jgi:type I restriction enzyme M protein
LDLAVYGQEMDNATSAPARMNTVLHDCPTAELWPSNSLSSPHFRRERNALRLKTFDCVVAEPRFSQKNWIGGLAPANDPCGRFGLKERDWGVPQPRNGDYAFVPRILTSPKSTGRGAVSLPHGALFRGGAEGAIRKKLVQHAVILALLVGLPASLVHGTGIPGCMVGLVKARAAGRRSIFMLDASKGFIKEGNKNRLRAQNMHRIADTFRRQLQAPRQSRMVPVAEIEADDFKLNVPRDIDTSEPEDVQDIRAHLKGAGVHEPGIQVASVARQRTRRMPFLPVADYEAANAGEGIRLDVSRAVQGRGRGFGRAQAFDRRTARCGKSAR